MIAQFRTINFSWSQPIQEKRKSDVNNNIFHRFKKKIKVVKFKLSFWPSFEHHQKTHVSKSQLNWTFPYQQIPTSEFYIIRRQLFSITNNFNDIVQNTLLTLSFVSQNERSTEHNIVTAQLIHLHRFGFAELKPTTDWNQQSWLDKSVNRYGSLIEFLNDKKENNSEMVGKKVGMLPNLLT